MAAAGDVEFGCVVAAAGAPDASDRPLHLGLGRGTAKLEFDAFGLDMGEARQRFAETWEILRLGMTGEPFSYPGKLRPVTQPVRIRPKPQTGQLHFYGAIGSPDSAAIMARLGLAPLCNTIGDIQQQAGTLRVWAAAAVEAGHSTAGGAVPAQSDRR